MYRNKVIELIDYRFSWRFNRNINMKHLVLMGGRLVNSNSLFWEIPFNFLIQALMKQWNHISSVFLTQMRGKILPSWQSCFLAVMGENIEFDSHVQYYWSGKVNKYIKERMCDTWYTFDLRSLSHKKLIHSHYIDLYGKIKRII